MGGSPVNSVRVLYGNLVEEPEEPVRKGYDFAGWYTDKSYTKRWLFDQYGLISGGTLYARWVDNGRVMVLKEKAALPKLLTTDRTPEEYFVAPKGLATVDKKGNITAKKEGTVLVMVTRGYELLESFEVTIEKPVVEKLTDLRVGETAEEESLISGTCLGASWESSKPGVADFDENGNLVALSKGTTKITARIHGKKYRGTVKVR